jgi:hypothetical protein
MVLMGCGLEVADGAHGEQVEVADGVQGEQSRSS